MKETITIDESKVLSFAVESATHHKLTILGLLLIEENQALRPKIQVE